MRELNPDYQQFIKVIRRERPDRPVLFEHGIEWPLMFEALGQDAIDNDNPPWGWLINTCQAFARLGYDVCPLPIHWFFNFHFVPPQKRHGESVSQNHDAFINSMQDIRDYKWPEPAACDFGVMDKVAAATPQGMKWILYAPSGIFESLVDLFGFENLCVFLYEEPELVKAAAQEVGERTLAYIERGIHHEAVCGFFISDDMGYKTSTMVSPQVLREFILPWHKVFVEVAHRAERFAILHACGCVNAIMEDIIEDCGFDAKHSFEDVILPPEEAYKKYGDRITILGGLDNDFLARRSPDAIRQRIRNLLETTTCRGYALGSGNSLTANMPRENLKILWESRNDDLPPLASSSNKLS